MPRGVPVDLTSRVYGDWEVLSRTSDGTGRKKRYLCRCSCGNEAAVQAGNLTGGYSKGCTSCALRRAWVTRRAEKHKEG